MASLQVLTVLLLVAIVFALDPACNKKPDRGPCSAQLTRYYYDSATRKCKTFIYGGCLGVAPFRSLAECQHKCIGSSSRCYLKPNRGPCSGSYTRYYYNAATRRCQSFIWGGCLGTVPFTWWHQCYLAGCG